MIRQITTITTFRSIKHVRNRLEVILRNSKLFGVLRSKIEAVPRSLKDQSTNVLRVWAHQCECVVAQRLRRGQQMFSLYSKLWDERALQELFRQMRQRLGTRGRDFVIGALGVAGYDWRSNKICDSEIKKHKDELEYVYKLKEKTLCSKCDKNSRICRCEDGSDKPPATPKLSSYDDWKIFIEKSDLVVWRRLHPSGNYEYKVYGSYDDVTAEDFLNVQIDIDYRRQWDKTAVSLNVIESNPDPGSNSDVVYWEMQWPKLFANRDYVFNRRFLVDHKSKTLYLVSKSTKHPNCPKEQTKFRIEDYWSYMVIKPHTELNKPGIEFSLTYFDNPGVNIPAAVTTWVAMKAMPEFCEKLREASKKYRIYCEAAGVCRICNIMDQQKDDEFKWVFFDDDLIVDNTIYEAQYKIIKKPESGEGSDSTNSRTGGDAPKPTQKPVIPVPEEQDSSIQGGTSVQPSESNSFWRWNRLKELLKRKFSFGKLF